VDVVGIVGDHEVGPKFGQQVSYGAHGQLIKQAEQRAKGLGVEGQGVAGGPR
jgi:hypothetical protein